MQKTLKFEEKEQEQEKSNVVDLKLISGGGSESKGWLGDLPVGAHFLFRSISRRTPEDVGVQRAVVVYHFEKCTLLFDNLNQPLYFIVETGPFSNAHRKLEVIHHEPAEQQQTEQPAGE